MPRLFLEWFLKSRWHWRFSWFWNLVISESFHTQIWDNIGLPMSSWFQQIRVSLIEIEFVHWFNYSWRSFWCCDYEMANLNSFFSKCTYLWKHWFLASIDLVIESILRNFSYWLYGHLTGILLAPHTKISWLGKKTTGPQANKMSFYCPEHNVYWPRAIGPALLSSPDKVSLRSTRICKSELGHFTKLMGKSRILN